MAVIGSARQDENGKYVNGKRGDQKQTASPDYKGEVSRQNFYVHSKGWYVLRPKNPVDAMKIAQAMARACDNKHIGYSQSDRLAIVSVGTESNTDTNCDCSSLVRTCVKEGTNKDAGNFTTANEVARLMATGLFEKHEYKNGFTLLDGDVLVTKTKGHTAIVIQGDKKPISEVAREVIAGKWGNGIDRKNRLHAAGYDYAEVQAEVNRLLNAPKKMSISDNGMKFIQQFEGCRLQAYKDIAGVWTIGWGTTSGVKEGMTITQSQADDMFRKDLEKFDDAVNALGLSLSQSQHDSLVSFAYNCGIGSLKKLVMNRTKPQIAEAMLLYNKARVNGVLQPVSGLTRRRKAEHDMFLS